MKLSEMLFGRDEEEYKRKPPLPKSATYLQVSGQFQERAAQPRTDQENVSFTFFAPTIIALMADLHIGAKDTDYKRIESEVEKIRRTAHMYVILAGDLADNMHWNPGQFEQAEQTPEQLVYLRALLEYLGRDKKLLHSIGGDHEGWMMKQGFDINSEMARHGASHSRGPTYFDLRVGKNKYAMAGAHQLPGHSIYNVTHPQMRAVRFGSMHGADVVFSGHNHKKGTAMAYQHELGEPQQTHYIALGPYKAHDSWLAKKGWARQKPLEMGGVAVKFGAVGRDITIYEDIQEAR